jgi:hypothetical protein
MIALCQRCRGARWVCETHPWRPWGEVEGACECGGAGMPCPLCNASDDLTEPEMPPGFVEDDGKRH